VHHVPELGVPTDANKSVVIDKLKLKSGTPKAGYFLANVFLI